MDDSLNRDERLDKQEQEEYNVSQKLIQMVPFRLLFFKSETNKLKNCSHGLSQDNELNQVPTRDGTTYTTNV